MAVELSQPKSPASSTKPGAIESITISPAEGGYIGRCSWREASGSNGPMAYSPDRQTVLKTIDDVHAYIDNELGIESEPDAGDQGERGEGEAGG